MKIKEKCIPCIVSQAIKVADMAGLKEKDELLRSVFSYLSKVDFKGSSTPELIGEIFSLLKEETGNDDPYKETRTRYNQMLLQQLPRIECEVDRSDNPFLESIKYAIIGNIIDFNPIHELLLTDIWSCFAQLRTEELEVDDSLLLIQEIHRAGTLLYLGDNCGEICLDKILIKKIMAINPQCRLFFAVRGAAVVNDSVEEDAYGVGMDAYATIISNGDSSLGTVLHRTSEEFREIYRKADVIIAKDIDVPEMKMICIKKK